jgi:DNA primase
MSRGNTMFNLGRLQQKQNLPILVVEGWLDAVFLWPHAVAVLGMPSTWQMEQLARAPDPVVFVLDGDAWRTGEALSWRLKLDGRVSGFVKLPPTLDPDDLEPQVIFQQAAQAVK